MNLRIGAHTEDMRPPSHALARNTLFNFCGQSITLVVAVFTIPLLIRGMGTQRFGVLALLWSFVGYFSLFDLGLGRALTTLVARSLTKEQDNIPSLIWTGFSLLVVLGIAGALSLVASAPWVVQRALNMPFPLKDEGLTALYMIAVGFPFVITQAGFRGVLEGLQRFDIVNSVNVAFGIISFAGSLLVLQFSTHLGVLLSVVLAGRLAGWMVLLGFCVKLIPNMRYWKIPEPVLAARLLAFGGWMTVSNVVGPLMVYLDRFLIGAWISLSAVAYYTTPYDIVTRLLIIPTALVSALFPVFSSSHVLNPGNNKALFTASVKYIYIALFPLTLIIAAFAREGLSFWLDDIFATKSAVVLQWLAAGVLINSLAQVPLSLIQSAGRPDLTAKLHLLELPLYLVCVALLLQHLGIKGAAIAWAIRVSIDTILLFFLAWRSFLQKPSITVSFVFAMIASLIGLWIVSSLDNALIKLSVCIIILAIFALGSYRHLLSSNERMNLIINFKKLPGQLGKKYAQ